MQVSVRHVIGKKIGGVHQQWPNTLLLTQSRLSFGGRQVRDTSKTHRLTVLSMHETMWLSTQGALQPDDQ